MTIKVCAYCLKNAKLTREHIWPASIVREVNDRARYAPGIAKMIWSDLVIKDVCEACNNGPLSTLDSYGSNLFHKYFSSYIKDVEPLLFEYNYSTLARWLLKLSFNAARAAKSDADRLGRYAAALIDEAIPLPDDFSIALDLVLPSVVPGSEREILPASNRLGRIVFAHGIDDWCTVRLVAVNSYYFSILIQDKPDEEVNPDHARAVISRIRGVYLDPESSQATLRASGVTTLEMHKDWADALRERAP